MLSADGHIDLFYITEDIFREGAPDHLKDRVPAREGAAQWIYKGKHLFGTTLTDRAHLPKSAQIDRMLPTGIFDDVGVEGRSRAATPALRVEDQDRDGVVGDVIYGMLALDMYMTDDLEAFRYCLLRYYEWVANFVAYNPNRFAPLAPISAVDPVQAAEDVHRIAEMGLKGFELRPRTASKPFYHKDWEPVWRAAVETKLPVHFHSDVTRLYNQGNFVINPDDPDAGFYKLVTSALIGSLGKMVNAESLGTMILAGVLERYPEMTLVMGECDISWIPHFLDRMDYCVTEREHSTGLPHLPSDYWRRQCKATFQFDKLGVEIIRYVGVDNVMWGNDYPHPDGVWPNSQAVAADHGSSLTDEERQKVYYSNCHDLYGIGAA